MVGQGWDLNSGEMNIQNCLYHSSHLVYHKLASFILWPGSVHFDFRLNGPAAYYSVPL